MSDVLNTVLNTEQVRVAFVKGLVKVIKIDGEIHPIEKEFITTFVDEMLKVDLDIEKLMNSEIPIEEIQFQNEQQVMLFLKEALQLCYVDGLYHEKEKELMGDFAKNLGISNNIFKKLEKWTLDGINWYNDAIEIFGENSVIAFL